MQEIKKRYVIPGDKIVEGNYRPLMNVIKNGNYLISTRVGIAEAGKEGVKVIPLSGVYIPRVNDLVIGKVVDRSSLSWDIDINSCFFAHLPAQDVFGRDFSPARDDMGRQLSVGDLIIARIVSFDRTRDPMLTVQDKDLGKIPYGEFIKISPTRVPRLIGKRGSMIQTIEQATLTRVIIGQNGIVVVTGRDIDGLSLAVKAIKMVEEESHTNNLTQKVKALLNVQDPAESEKSENINISSGDGVSPTPSQASNFQSNSSSGLSSGVDSATMEQEPQQATMEQEPQQATMEQEPQQATMEQEPQQATMEQEPQQATMEQEPQQATMEQEPQQATMEQEPQQATMEQEPQQATMEQEPQQATMEQEPQQATMEQEPQQATMEQEPQQATMEQEPQQQNSSNEDPANTSKTDEEQSENQLSDNLTKANQKKKKHDLISEEDE